jgi:putative phosphoserine phosphatase/1-acylglycerol-3-phosphate O-acyltransferase
VWWLLDFIRIDRANHARAIAALEGVPGLLVRERRTLFVAPEGTRTRDGSILRFKKGAFHIARQAGVPVCPVVVAGAFELLPRGHLLPRRGVIRLSYLEPVSSAGVTHETEGAWIEDIRSKMVREYERIRRPGD